MTHSGNALTLKDVTVIQANALLDASYQLYRHVESSETVVRTVGYALPAALHGHVLTVAPTTTFVSPPTQWQTPHNRSGRATEGLVKSASGEPATVLSGRDDDLHYITPSFLRWQYYTDKYTPSATDRNVLGVAGYIQDTLSQTDLAAFMLKYRADAADATFTVVQVNGGGYDPNRHTREANSIIQYAEAMAYPTPHTYYSTGRGSKGTDDWFISWLRYILAQDSIPQTISTSYSYSEDDASREYADFVCELFGALGLRGVSLLVSSGNTGVGQGNCVQFKPRFPASCTCGVLAVVVHKCRSRTLTTSPCFGRSLGHHRRRNDGLRTRDRSEFLRRRLLELLSARGIPEAGSVHFH
jgi:tripeptidyl-peptidase-1